MKNWGGGVKKLNQELNSYLALGGGTVTGDLILGYDPVYAKPAKLKMGLSETSGFEISSADNALTIVDKDKKSILELTPSSISYFNEDIKITDEGQIEIVATNNQDILIDSGNILFHYDRIIRGVDYGVEDNDAVNLGQIKELSVMRRCQITVHNPTLINIPIVTNDLYLSGVDGMYTVHDDKGNDITQNGIDNFFISPSSIGEAYTSASVNVQGERMIVTWLSPVQLKDDNDWIVEGYYF